MDQGDIHPHNNETTCLRQRTQIMQRRDAPRIIRLVQSPLIVIAQDATASTLPQQGNRLVELITIAGDIPTTQNKPDPLVSENRQRLLNRVRSGMNITEKTDFV